MTSRLHAVPETAPRALALVRVSKERDGMISPELQDTAIGDYCARTGLQITRRMEGLDESGSRAKSRWWAKLDEAVGMVEAGEIDVIVVWKFSRTARNRLRWAVALDRVETAGGRLESATEQVDATTSTGRFTRGMLAELNAFEAERIGEQWRETHARRRDLGLPHDGGRRVGYLYDGGSYRKDPDTAPIITELYQRYVDGQGLRPLAEWLTAMGVPTRGRRARWSGHGIGTLLDAGFAAGLLHVHDPACRCGRQERDSCRRRVHIPGSQEPIVGQRLWESYRRERARRAVTPPRLLAPTSPLAGLVRCAACGYAMQLKPRGNGTSMYRCTSDSCPRPTTLGRLKAETAAKAWLRQYAHQVEQEAAAAAAARTARTLARTETTRLARSVNQLDAELVELTRQLGRGIIPEGAYVATRDELLTERAAIAARLEATQAARAESRRPSRVVAAAALSDWDTLPAADLNGILRELLVVVAAHGGTRTDVAVRGEWEPYPRPPM